MRLTLADIPKRFSRRDNPVSVTPRLLKSRDAGESLAALIGLYEASLGLTRAEFPEDRPAQIAGDVRLARCLSGCLLDWYAWTSAPWPQPASPDEAETLARIGIDGPSALRLALYRHVNARYGGFVATDQREDGLDAFAADSGLMRATLNALLAQDDPRAARLTRMSDEEPTGAALAARYNQRAVETLLMNASAVTWRLEPREGARLGEMVKRICFLARRMGVSYEVALDEQTQAPELLVAERRGGYAAPTPLDRARQPVLISLQGPREMVGAANQYGDRLARLCRALLGYRRADPAAAALGDLEALSGVATLHLHGRPCQFILDERLAKLLRAGAAADGAPDAVTFDSSLEQRLHADFAALERAGETAGWRLEREPEPLLLGETILVPDFALTRESRRVYLEVAGYWRPEYRLRKARKLAALAGAVAMIVAAPEAARAEFTGLDASYPFVWYRAERISAPAVVAALQRAYDDFAGRLAALDLPALLAEVARRGAIPPTEAAAALHSYTRDEQTQALAALAGHAASQGATAPEWLDGLGLCAASLLDRLAARARVAVAAAGGRLALSELGARISETSNGHEKWAELTEAAVEALAMRAGLQVERASLFAAEAVIPALATAAPASETLELGIQPAFPTSDPAKETQPRKPAPRRHSGAGWSTGDLFADGATSGEDASE